MPTEDQAWREAQRRVIASANLRDSVDGDSPSTITVPRWAVCLLITFAVAGAAAILKTLMGSPSF